MLYLLLYSKNLARVSRMGVDASPTACFALVFSMSVAFHILFCKGKDMNMLIKTMNYKEQVKHCISNIIVAMAEPALTTLTHMAVEQVAPFIH
jgi:hypothetical protein